MFCFGVNSIKKNKRIMYKNGVILLSEVWRKYKKTLVHHKTQKNRELLKNKSVKNKRQKDY